MLGQGACGPEAHTGAQGTHIHTEIFPRLAHFLVVFNFFLEAYATRLF